MELLADKRVLDRLKGFITNSPKNSSGASSTTYNWDTYKKKYGETLDRIKTMLPTGQESSTFLTGAQNRYRQISDPNYKAISDDELNRIFNQRKETLYKDVITPEDEKLAARLAISGQTGGGVAGGNWEDKSYQNKRLLSDVYNEVQNMGLSQTLQDRSSLLSLAPALSSMYTQERSYPLSAWSQYAGLIGDEANRYVSQYAADRQAEAARKSSRDSSLGGLIGGFFSKI